ncbi:MAG: winged helix-turn-helix domain-containing protein [Candidatus Bathyarchaeia archaeon]
MNLRETNKKRSNKHRGSLDIIADILEASKGKTKKTYLMYRCNLSFKQMENYLSFLLKRELLKAIEDNGNNKSFFRITEKGERFLETYKGLQGLME